MEAKWTWKDNRCETCGMEPSFNERRQLVCGCPEKLWVLQNSIAVSPAQEQRLETYGFTRATDIGGNIYYCHPSGPLLEFYEDGTWEDKRIH